MKKIGYFSILALLFFSCHKSYPSKSRKIVTNLKNYYNFKPGSYWIYKDSVTGQTDSFAVTKNDSGSASYPVVGLCDYIDIHFTEYTTAAINLNIDDWQFLLDEIYVSPLLGTPLFSYPNVKTKTFPHASDVCTVTDVLHNYTIEGKTFDSVAEINHTDRGNSYDHYVYACDEVGIVKMRKKTFSPGDTTLTVWELQRYHIVK